MNKKIIFFLCLIFSVSFLLNSCKSIKQPESVVVPIDYTDEDVVQNEISTIKNILQSNSVKALYRSLFLGDENIIQECETQIKNEIREIERKENQESKDFLELQRLYKALETANVEDFEKSQVELNNYVVPGFGKLDEKKRPVTIQNCIDATATIWIDKGFKVENGNGIWDVVIGSGFFIDERGYLITNHHVIESMVDSKDSRSSRLYIKIPSDMDTKIPAEVIGYDPIVDLALLKADIEPEYVFELGSSSDLSIGDRISAIGTPLGLEGTLTSGIISSANRKLSTMGNVFQLDAAVNSGNSGGPIIDENKKVQAIVFAGILQYQGLNFAIPVEYLKQELPLLYAGLNVSHTWISAYGHTKKEKNKPLGVEIQYVMPGGSAAFSGLKDGDIIVEFDGQEIQTIEDFHALVMKYPANTLVKCCYLRDNVQENTLLLLEKRGNKPLLKIYENDFIQDSFVPIFGIKMVPSSTTNRKSYRITKVVNGSLADENGFSVNDTIEVHDVKLDYENNYIMAQIIVSRRKKGYLNVPMLIYAQFDSPYCM